MCFQEVSQLATEEVSIFRQMEAADRLSSEFRVKNLSMCRGGTDYLCACVFVSLEDVKEDFSH